MNNNADIIKDVLAGYVNKDISIKDDSRLSKDLAIDSLNYIKIICDIEEVLKIEISDDFLDINDDITFKEFCQRIMIN